MIRTALVTWVVSSVPVGIILGSVFRSVATPVPGWGMPPEATSGPLARVTSR